MSSQADAHEILTDLNDIIDRTHQTYGVLLAEGDPLDYLMVEQTLGRLIELRRSFVGYLDEWDGATYEAMRLRGWLPS